LPSAFVGGTKTISISFDALTSTTYRFIYIYTLWTGSLNSDVNQLKPISWKQRTVVSNFKWAHRTPKRPRSMTSEKQVLTWDKHKNVAGSQLSPLDNWIYNDNTSINKWWKTWINSLPLKQKPNTSFHKNEWQFNHGQYNNRSNECF
jgi:hypothetical protein